ncbi:MAG: oligosaccharide flippase family protein, partial [Caldilineaceae bacterium]
PAVRRSAYGQARVIMVTLACAITVLVGVAAISLRGAAAGETLTLLGLLFLSLPPYALMAAALTIFEASERFDLVLAVDATVNTLLLVLTSVVLVVDGNLAAVFVTVVVVQLLGAALAMFLLRRVAAWPAGASPEAARTSWPASAGLLRRAGPTFGLALTDVVQQRLDLLLVGLFTTPATTGIYAAAVSLVRVLYKLAQAWWRSLYPTLSRLRDKAPEQGARLAALATRLGVSGSLPAVVLLTTAALPIVSLLFGADYAAAAPLLQLLAWSAPLYLLVLRAIVLLLVERRPRASLAVALSQVATLLILLPVALAWRGVDAAPVAVVAACLPPLWLGAWLQARTSTATLQQSDAFPTSNLRPVAIVAGSALCAAAALALPLEWPLQSLVALAASFLLIGLTRSLTRSDVAQLRRALGTKS